MNFEHYKELYRSRLSIGQKFQDFCAVQIMNNLHVLAVCVNISSSTLEDSNSALISSSNSRQDIFFSCFAVSIILSMQV